MDEKFRNLKDEAQAEIFRLNAQLIQIDKTLSDLEEKAHFIQKNALTKIANDLKDYLENKKVCEINDLQKKTGMVYFGTNYNNHADIDNADLTSWSIKSPDSSVMYSLNYNWDNDETILKLIDTWNWWHDYLTHKMDSFDGAYGVYQMIETMARSRDTIHGTIMKLSQITIKIGEI